MKTTPNPNATKKSNGELEGELPPVGGAVVCAGAVVVVVVDVGARGRVVEVVPPAACGLRATNLKTSPTACSMIATIVAAVVVLDGRVVVVVVVVVVVLQSDWEMGDAALAPEV